jgi:hypothetical protein
MTFVWLIVWLFAGTPDVHLHGPGPWTVAFVVCLLIDLMEARSR